MTTRTIVECDFCPRQIKAGRESISCGAISFDICPVCLPKITAEMLVLRSQQVDNGQLSVIEKEEK